MLKITPHLWFDKEANEAATLYTSVFQNSKIKHKTQLHNTPSGTVDIVSIELAGQEFKLLSAGPLFKFTPAVSFRVACTTKGEVNALWKSLSKGGSVLMELGKYTFCEWFGWMQDQYGLSWQLMFTEGSETRQKITPMLMFVGPQCEKAEAAIKFYTSLFPGSAIDHIHRYGSNESPDVEGTIKQVGFTLNNQLFAAMDSAHQHNFSFNEAISFIVQCDTQEELDHYWAALSAVPESEQCGWLKDQYGLSWQIVPTLMDEMIRDNDQTKLARVTQAFLAMKKFDVEKLKAAYAG